MSISKSFINLNEFEEIQSISSGSLGEVWLVKNKTSGLFYEAKVLNLKLDEKKREQLLFYREINIISFLNHPSIQKFIGYSPKDFKNDPFPTIIMEYAKNRTVEGILKLEEKGVCPDEWNYTQKLIIIYGIASGMAYLHSHNILHRDLKTRKHLFR